MLFDPYAFDLAATAGQPTLGDAALADALLEVPIEIRSTIWHGLMEAVSGAFDLWECTPPGVRRAPPAAGACGCWAPALSLPLVARAPAPARAPVQHAGRRRFHPAHLQAQTLTGWHRMMGLEARLAAQTLEDVLLADSLARQEDLAEQCARMGQLYSELKRRAGEDIARAITRWELRLLRYCASPILASLIYD